MRTTRATLFPYTTLFRSGRVAQGGNVLRRFQAGVDQILGQCTDDAVAASIDLADLVRMLASGFDNPGSRGVDYCGNPAGLGVEGVLDGHAGSKIGRASCRGRQQ